ncbi:MAG: cbb3-type cytochrome oxidase assembly protein CcoS [Gammaproteobacteria bacterium]|nr:cbb3-type cytochrome oxidase assembly protein CcoS [Gammaproteobacteria bacterium]
MEVIYGLIPSMIIIGIVLVIILFWAIKSGQFDDLEGDAHRILMDEDLTPKTPQSKENEKNKDKTIKTR